MKREFTAYDEENNRLVSYSIAEKFINRPEAIAKAFDMMFKELRLQGLVDKCYRIKGCDIDNGQNKAVA